MIYNLIMITKQKARNEIKKHLWTWGHTVKDVSGLLPYDLLIDGKIKVKVVLSDKWHATDMRVTSGCDVMAVIVTDLGNNKIYSLGTETEPRGMKKFRYYTNTLKNALAEKIK